MEDLLNIKVLSNSGIQKMMDIGIGPFFFVLMCSLISSFLVSHLYVRFYGTKGTGSTLHRAFPILGVAITAIFVCLQFSIPLSLGLLGALSIVRFRTPIKDPEEVGFILLVIASSITCATFNISFLLLIMAVSFIGLVILKKDFPIFRKNRYEGVIILNLPDSDNKLQDNLIERFSTGLVRGKLDSITETEFGATISYSFSEKDKDSILKIKSQIAELSPNVKTNIFFNQTHL